LDPHISVRNAELQAPRVARARQLDLGAVMKMVRANTDGPDLGLLGEAGVNVLKLNLALDSL
jgi:K+-transporting ATPase ATPase C chain